MEDKNGRTKEWKRMGNLQWDDSGSGERPSVRGHEQADDRKL